MAPAAPPAAASVKRHGLTDRLFHGIDAILGIGQSGRNRNLPGQQTWQPPARLRPSPLALLPGHHQTTDLGRLTKWTT